MATILSAPAITAPWIAPRPTPPSPKMATTEPFSTFAVFRTAPIPVVIPHPNRQTFSKGACELILATAISGSTVYSENVEVPI